MIENDYPIQWQIDTLQIYQIERENIITINLVEVIAEHIEKRKIRQQVLWW